MLLEDEDTKRTTELKPLQFPPGLFFMLEILVIVLCCNRKYIAILPTHCVDCIPFHWLTLVHSASVLASAHSSLHQLSRRCSSRSEEEVKHDEMGWCGVLHVLTYGHWLCRHRFNVILLPRPSRIDYQYSPFANLHI